MKIQEERVAPFIEMANIGDSYGVSVTTRGIEEFPHEAFQYKIVTVSDEARVVLEIIFYSVIGCLTGVVGSAVNVINIIVFVKQGFNDSVSISLCGLALSDLGFLLWMTFVTICSNPLVHYSDTNVDTAQVSYSIGGLFQSCFVRITHLITAFITFERCVCVALPMKVKSIITPKRTLISVVVIYAIIFVESLPVFAFFYLAPSFNAKRNKTLIGFMYTSKTYHKALNSIDFPLQLGSYLIVVICTAILVLKLLSKSKWRNKAVSTSDASDSLSARDKRVMKMVTLVSGIFITCYLPTAINFTLMVYLSPEYGVTGRYENSYIVSWSIIDCIDGINSSVTILVYYIMSSKFRATFQDLFFPANKSPTKI